MAENVRDVIRAAQSAELGGDKQRAVELFLRAVELCRRAGNTARAAQLLRYALRLEPTRADLREELERLEAQQAPGSPEEPAPAEGALQEALREAERSLERRVNPVEQVAQAMRSAVRGAARGSREDAAGRAGDEGRFIERGPTRADPALDAWCSFCCRPRAEVGPLVAGPAGAFICASCVGESGGLLGDVLSRAPASRPRAPARRPAPSTHVLLGQDAAREALERGLAQGLRRVLLVGREGAGKSTWVRSLAEQGLGQLVTLDSLERTSVDVPLLLEDVDRLSAPEQAQLGVFLGRHPLRTVLMTCRGSDAVKGPELLSDTGRRVVPTTAELAESTGGVLPLALLEQVQLLVALEPPGVALLCDVARRELAAREDCTLSDEALTALAEQAAHSPRLGHELKALLARLPPGTWRLGKANP